MSIVAVSKLCSKRSKVRPSLLSSLSPTPDHAAAKSLQSCPTLCDPRDGAPRLPGPWASPGKNTGVGCHFLLQRMKVKSENEVAQPCPTLSDPLDCSPSGSSIRGMFPGKSTGVECHFLLHPRPWAPAIKHLLIPQGRVWDTALEVLVGLFLLYQAKK